MILCETKDNPFSHFIFFFAWLLRGRSNNFRVACQNMNKIPTFYRTMKIIPTVSIHLIDGRFFTGVRLSSQLVFYISIMSPNELTSVTTKEQLHNEHTFYLQCIHLGVNDPSEPVFSDA